MDNWDPNRRKFNPEDRHGGGRDNRYDDRRRSPPRRRSPSRSRSRSPRGRSPPPRDRSFNNFNRRPMQQTTFKDQAFRDKADSMHSVKVEGMTLRTDRDDVREKFEKFGEIGDLFFPPDRETKASRGFCYVRFVEKSAFEDCIDAYEKKGVELDGRTCDVAESIPTRVGRWNPSMALPKEYNDRGGFSRYDDRGRGGYGGGRDRYNSGGRSRSRSPAYRGRGGRSPSPKYRGKERYSPRRNRSRTPDYDKYRRRSPVNRSRSRSPYRR